MRQARNSRLALIILKILLCLLYADFCDLLLSHDRKKLLKCCRGIIGGVAHVKHVPRSDGLSAVLVHLNTITAGNLYGKDEQIVRPKNIANLFSYRKGALTNRNKSFYYLCRFSLA